MKKIKKEKKKIMKNKKKNKRKHFIFMNLLYLIIYDFNFDKIKYLS